MGRPAFITALAIALTLPAWAQHGGGHAGGGHAGGFSGHSGFAGHSSFASHPSGSAGMRSAPRASGNFSRPATRPSFNAGPMNASRSNFRGNFTSRSFRRGPVNSTFGFNRCFGCRRNRFLFPYGYANFYDPYWWGNSGSNYGSNYDQDYENDRAIANDMNAQSLQEQQMRQQYEQSQYQNQDQNQNQSQYARPAAPSQPEAQTAPLVPDTVLVFRDQRRQEIRNYAIVGQTLWHFSSQRTEKIPLSTLDLPATVKANDDRGLTFQIPASTEAQ
jgi:hypothetical protein